MVKTKCQHKTAYGIGDREQYSGTLIERWFCDECGENWIKVQDNQSNDFKTE